MDIEAALNETVEEEINGQLNRNREHVVTELITAFMDLRKNAVPDLPARIETFTLKIRQMVAGLHIKLVDGEVVVKASADGELTLRLLKAGGQWFSPMADVNDRIMRGIYA